MRYYLPLSTNCRHILYLSAAHSSLGLEHFTEVQSGHVNCCVDLIWNE